MSEKTWVRLAGDPSTKYKSSAGHFYGGQLAELSVKEFGEFSGGQLLDPMTGVVLETKTKKKSVKAPVKKKRSREELFDLKRDEQFSQLKDLGVETKDIPRYEEDRVKLLLKLQ